MQVMWKEVTPDRKVLPIGEKYTAVSVPNVRFLSLLTQGTHPRVMRRFAGQIHPWRLKLKTDAK